MDITNVEPDDVKEFISSVNLKSKKYITILLSSLIIMALSRGITYSSTPFMFRDRKYNCKANATDTKFSVYCNKTEICENHNLKENIDYVYKGTDFTSIIDQYEIYCQHRKISIFSSSLFIGALFVIPISYIISKWGLLSPFKILQIMIIVLTFSATLIHNYYFGYIVFVLLFFKNSCFLIIYPIFSIECLAKEIRGALTSIIFVASSIGSLLGVLVYYLANEEHYFIFLTMSCLCFLELLMSHFLIVDAPLTTLARGDKEKLFKDLEKISKTNNCVELFNDWKEKLKEKYNDVNDQPHSEEKLLLNCSTTSTVNQNIAHLPQNHIDSNTNFVSKLDWITIWKYKSEVKIITVTLLLNIVITSTNYFLFIYAKEYEGIYLSVIITALIDLAGGILGTFILSFNVQRRITLDIALACSAILFLAAGISLTKYTIVPFVIIALIKGITTFYASYYIVYFYELVSVAAKPVAGSITKTIPRIVNSFLLPLFISSITLYCVIGCVFSLLSLVMLFVFRIRETKNQPLKQIPDEMNEIINEKKE